MSRVFNEEIVAELESICARYPDRKAALLPALRIAEREFGCIDLDAMREVGKHIGVSPATVFGVVTFYTHYKRETDGENILYVCSTLPCALRGSEAVFDHLSQTLGIGNNETTPDGKFTLKKVECLANCDQAPCLQVDDDFVDRVDNAQCDEIVAALRDGTWEAPPQIYHMPECPYEPVLLKHVLDTDSHTLEQYMGRGGYAVAKDTLTSGRDPDEIVQMVLDSGLRGRGGAGFPCGRKWTFLPKNDKPRYLVVNADESEPGTFKDKLLIDKDPHLVLEGIILSAYAIRSSVAYIYIRGEFVEGARILNRAIAECYEKGFLGKGIFGSDFDLDVTVHRGAGAYICGEETGLLSSLEGKRGNPKIKPPFPAIEGAWSCPTIVNNVETLANVSLIVKHGADWFKGLGTEKSPGTKIFSVCGNVERPGNYELPLGVPIKDLIYDICGGIPGGKKLKAVIPGGSSAPFLTADEVHQTDPVICMDFDSLKEAGTMLGSGAVIVIDEDHDIVDALYNVLRFYAHESCGQCTPCREGTGWIAKMAGRLAQGNATVEEIDKLDEVAWGMVGRTICVLADAAAMPARSVVQKFRPDFEALIHQKSGK